jgi:ribosome-binding protein aMBF1 (putative translation factor)
MKMITAIGSRPEMTKHYKRDLQRLVGRRIRVARKNAGLFQRELAERVGYPATRSRP